MLYSSGLQLDIYTVKATWKLKVAIVSAILLLYTLETQIQRSLQLIYFKYCILNTSAEPE